MTPQKNDHDTWRW